MIKAFLFTGIAGLKKRERLAHLRHYLLSTYDPYDGSEPADHVIPIVELARLTRQEVEGELFDLYNTYSERLQKFQQRLKTFQAPTYKAIRCVFIHTHLTNLMTGHFRSWVGSADYANLFPGVEIKKIIHLIDNVYTCQCRVAADGYPYTLDQLMIWRDNEQMATEILAGLLFGGTAQFENSKVIAVNHCLRTIADVLFKEQKHELYMAYPISKIRDVELLRQTFPNTPIDSITDAQLAKLPPSVTRNIDNLLRLKSALAPEFPTAMLADILQSLQRQNQEYRTFFTEEFIAYDPSTIDEVPLVDKATQAGDQTSVKLLPSDCWPLICEPAARMAGGDLLCEKGELEIATSEIRELRVPNAGDRDAFWTSINRQVRSRDFRLIEQSHGLVAYRPTLGGRWSTGVRQEIDYVYRHLKKPFYVIKDKHDAPLDEGQALGWEYGRECWGEWDLSSQANRQKAFETATDMLKKNIHDRARD